MNTGQKVIKYFAIGLAIFLIFGIVSGLYTAIKVLTGNVIVDKSGKGLDITKYKEDQSILSVDLAGTKLTIKEGSELKVESESPHIKIFQEDNKLQVEEETHKFKKNSKETVTIYIPKDTEFDKVYIASGAGTINIDNLTAKDLQLEIGAGKVEINNLVTLKRTEINGGLGKVTINNSKLTNLDLEVGVGEFILNSYLSGKNEIEAGIGSLSIKLLDGKDNYTIKAQKGIGSIKIGNNLVKNEEIIGSGENTLDIEGGIGSISISFTEEEQSANIVTLTEEERKYIENYIKTNHDLELKYKSVTISHRGNIGINPGREYYVIMENSMGFLYGINIDTIVDDGNLIDALNNNLKVEVVQYK